jgi:hypothetical protein
VVGYVRQDILGSIAPGQVARAQDVNAEVNALDAAFSGTTGHDHSGGLGQGPKINLNTGVTGSLPNGNIAPMAGSTIKGRAFGLSTGTPQDLTPVEARRVVDPQTVRPQDFGALGDGVANDSVAVQACFDYAEAQRVVGNPTKVELRGIYGLSSPVHIVATNLVAQGVSRRAGFKALTPSGYVVLGDARNLADIKKSPHCSFRDIGFDANYIAPFALKIDYDTQAPSFENCTFEKGILATVLVTPNVTQFTFMKCIWRLNGTTSSGSVVTACDALLNYGNGNLVESTLGGCTAWGLRQMGIATNPYTNAPPLEENHAHITGGRINSCYQGFVLNESQRIQHVALTGAAPSFTPGEIITGGTSGASGKFVMSVDTTLFLIDLTDTLFVAGETVTGGLSSLTGEVLTNTVGTQNQSGSGTIRTSIVGVYLENPGNGSPSDGGSDPTQLGGDAIVARGRKSAVILRGGTKHQIRGYARLLFADYDAKIDYWGANDLVAQVFGGTPRGSIAGSGISGDGTARVHVHVYPQRLISTGTGLTTDSQFEDPANAFSNFLAAGPHFKGPKSSGLGVVPPKTQLITKVIDGTTAALPSVATSGGALTAPGGGFLLFTCDGTTTGGKGFTFEWTPTANVVGKKLMFVAEVSMGQVGSVFGASGELPAPRVRATDEVTPANVWPAANTSTINQSIQPPGDGNFTDLFTMGTGFVPYTTNPVTLRITASSRTGPLDDLMRIYRAWVLLIDDDPIAGLT